QLFVKVNFIQKINPNVYLLTFRSQHIAKVAKPGQFIHIKIDGVILRRPFSVHNIKNNIVYILFSVRGRGTERLSKYKKGDTLDIIGPLGNGFRYKNSDKKINLLVAGGMGVAPLVFLAGKLNIFKRDYKNIVILGVKNRVNLLCKKEFEKLNFKIYISSEDGSVGYKGTAVSLLKGLLKKDKIERAQIYACGPKEMFFEISKILKDYPNINCQVSFEQFMGCGLGICCGCTIQTKEGYKKVCIDGPVFDLCKIY
ncbi:MAG: dihydroorotate dehydrogenase electron transfer subunit, partial [Candidatus Omnitrophica bacterium]|nr:dihydroorotate dehydrogenase electron transfer subunit [Candidatus Omnitrophota bacterium]